MGIADRDYMRERHKKLARQHDRAPGPPEPSAGLTLWMVMLFVGLAYGGYQAWRWLERSNTLRLKTAEPAAPQPEIAKPPRQYPNLTGNWDPNRQVEPVTPTTTPDGNVRTLTKCVINGVTLYAESPSDCAAHASQQVVINPNQNLSDGLRTPTAPRIPERHNTLPAPAAAPQAAQYVDPNIVKKATCLAYEEEIKQIDAHARQPISAWEQDRLAARRKRARDEQFRLRC